MNSETVYFLNDLNRQFYQTVASSFDETRAVPWAGWLRLLPYLQKIPAKPLRVLDIGCGNGRFGKFLNEHFDIHYTGLDNNAYLLERAAKTLDDIPHQLIHADILDSKPALNTYDLIVMFGLIHHIPAFENRRKLIMQTASHLQVQGLMVVTCWAFYEQDRFRQRIVDWDTLPNYEKLDLEEHDYLLDWRRETETPALRYCHYVNEAESQKLTEGLRVVDRFDADAANRYLLLSLPAVSDETYILADQP